MSNEELRQFCEKFGAEQQAFREANPNPPGWEDWMNMSEFADGTTEEKAVYVKRIQEQRAAAKTRPNNEVVYDSEQLF